MENPSPQFLVSYDFCIVPFSYSVQYLVLLLFGQGDVFCLEADVGKGKLSRLRMVIG